MCGISGFFHAKRDFTKERAKYQEILDSMNDRIRRRGPDDSGTFLSPHFGLAHVRLSIVDLVTGHQPMFKTVQGQTWGIVYNGELYNTDELRQELKGLGHTFETASDTEVILTSYLEYGPEFVTKLNGIFAIAIMDPVQDRLILYRDRAGVKPLFYTVAEETVVFSSELKGLLCFPGIKPRISKNGLNEIFSIGPARTSGTGVFEDVYEVLPGHYLICAPDHCRQDCYWKLESHPHEDSYEKTIETTAFLVEDSIRRQMVSDVPVCTFLSGGVDSSLVSSICAQELKKQNKRLTTFSFDFVGNKENFKANSFQPSQDRPYVEQMVSYLNSDHHFLECSTRAQAELLKDSVLAHDLPAMADVDSSMLYFCSQVSPLCKVALTGECADEIFGGYPWFHREECFKAHTFPWTMDLKARQVLLKDDFLGELHMEEYARRTYEASLAQTPALPGESPTEARRREISWLNLRWFMQTLLNRMDRTSMYSGLEARVPFADHRIIEYLWNVPWEMKAKDNVVKNLLRQAGRGMLPDEILFRRKSPYPKTYDKAYETLLAGKVRDILEDTSSPILQFIDREKTLRFLSSPSDYGKPWYGQLMAAPQMMAYVIQIDFWMRQYQVEVL
ncbi:MAG: asparagine synthase (glutamine-hydrolyzing) [Hungatella sp.]|jgi:asparagine synthase (glutamine-hydrolysing)|nr:asparagine synthase (glutamine-hydrolyzing) [Hungatella sp.]